MVWNVGGGGRFLLRSSGSDDAERFDEAAPRFFALCRARPARFDEAALDLDEATLCCFDGAAEVRFDDFVELGFRFMCRP